MAVISDFHGSEEIDDEELVSWFTEPWKLKGRFTESLRFIRIAAEQMTFQEIVANQK